MWVLQIATTQVSSAHVWPWVCSIGAGCFHPSIEFPMDKFVCEPTVSIAARKTCACATQALFDYIGCVFNNDGLVFCQDMSSQIQWIQNG